MVTTGNQRAPRDGLIRLDSGARLPVSEEVEVQLLDREFEIGEVQCN